jgi:hypothetical protein
MGAGALARAACAPEMSQFGNIVVEMHHFALGRRLRISPIRIIR